MGSAIASPSTTPVAFVGRPRGPPRCKSALLYHRAQVARPISQGLQGGETPFCARLRPVAPSCAWLRSPAPFCALLRPSAPFCALLRPSAPGCARLRSPAPFCALLRPSAPFCARLRSPAPFCALLHPSAPSHPDPFTLLHRHTPALRVTSSIVATTFPDGISLESPLSYSLAVFAEIA